jgi:Tol biopolymer transport system component
VLGRAALLVLLVSVLAGVARAAPEASNTALLYLRPLGGNAPPYGRLFVAGADGAGARDITPAGIRDVQGAAWSPDGRHIAISAIADGDLDPEIFIVAPDGTGLRRVTNNYLSDRQPTWSPDGRRIAFASARTGLFQIYSTRTNGGRQRRLSNQAEDCETPAWSPTGRWIVFSCELGYFKLVRMRPDGSGERRLLPGYPLTETSPSWTPDGRIVFSRGAKSPLGRGIFTVRADGTGLRRLRGSGGDPAVSPDGRLLAFVWMRDGANQEIYVMRRNGSGLRQITATNGVTEWGPDWRPVSR